MAQRKRNSALLQKFLVDGPIDITKTAKYNFSNAREFLRLDLHRLDCNLRMTELQLMASLEFVTNGCFKAVYFHPRMTLDGRQLPDCPRNFDGQQYVVKLPPDF